MAGMSSRASHDRVRAKAARPMNGARALRVVLSRRRGVGGPSRQVAARRVGLEAGPRLGQVDEEGGDVGARHGVSGSTPAVLVVEGVEPSRLVVHREGRERVVALAGPDADVAVAGHAPNLGESAVAQADVEGAPASPPSPAGPVSSGCRRSEIELMQ